MKSDYPLSLVWNLGGMFFVAMLAVVGFGTIAYLERASEIATSENGVATRDKLIEIANVNRSIREISGADGGVLKHKLSLQMATGLQQLRSDLWAEDYDLQTIGRRFCAHVLQEERTEPELYLSSAAKARAEEKQAWDALGDASFKLIPTPQKTGSDVSYSRPGRTDQLGVESAGRTNADRVQRNG